MPAPQFPNCDVISIVTSVVVVVSAESETREESRERAELVSRVQQLQRELEEVTHNYQSQVNDNSQLSR